MDHFNRAHQLLAASADTETKFLELAAQAVVIASQSRWGGVGFFLPESKDLQVVAFWQGDCLGEPFRFCVPGSPCEAIYKSPTVSGDHQYIHYGSDILTQFSDSELLMRFPGECYRAHAIHDDSQTVIGHVFSLDDKPGSDQKELRDFFNLLSKRISSEYNRFKREAELARTADMVKLTRNMFSFVDRSYTYHAVSQGYVDTFAQPHDELIGKKSSDLHGEAIFNNVLEPLLKRSFSGETVNSQIWIHPPNIKPKYIDVVQTPFYEIDGTISGVVLSGHDITPQKVTEETLQKLSLAVTHSPVLTVITTPEGVIEYVSPIVEAITGYSVEEVIGKTPRLFKSGRTNPSVYESLWKAIKNKQPWQGEIENKRKDGVFYWEYISIAPVLNDRGEVLAFVGSSMDITQRKQMESQLLELASTDSLTGVSNRRHFLEVVESHLAESERYKSPLSLMIIDIDKFKHLNDSGGHALGDEVIKQFTQICEQTIRNVDILGRLGGDEFAILLPETNAEKALILAERLKDAISAFKIHYEQNTLQITVSIGLSTYQNNEETQDTVQSLLARADEGLYTAKRGGRNLIGFV
ncbi:MAG: diguanylate cyclase [Sedimenticola sp.]|nr:diguanylate cyclase [Sedimenticola sp.]